MKVWFAILLLFLGMAAIALAVEKPYQAGKIVDAEQKANTRVLYYLVNTPVTEDDPYYEVSVQIGDKVFRGIHTPRYKAEKLPEDWKPNADVQVRVDGHLFFLKRANGEDMEFAISKRMTAKPVR
jgi:hypothetical protein